MRVVEVAANVPDAARYAQLVGALLPTRPGQRACVGHIRSYTQDEANEGLGAVGRRDGIRSWDRPCSVKDLTSTG